jgi:two-component system cell cycle sensor histidine kinase/response regulator CckA
MSKYILFLEDTLVMKEFVSKALTEAGFTYDWFPNPNEAYHAIEDNPKHYDAVVSDWEMPPMCDGLTFLMDIRLGGTDGIQLPPDIPFVMCSSYDDDDHINEAMETGASFYQKKSTMYSLKPMIDFLQSI